MYVGMNRANLDFACWPLCVPHVRGDEPSLYDIRTQSDLRSPCTWG